MNTPPQVRARKLGKLGEVDETGHPQHITPPGRYLSLRELSTYSGLSQKVLRRAMQGQGLPYYKMPRRVLVRLDEFDDWMAQFHRAPHVRLFDE